MNQPRSKRVDVDGWIILDKPVGMTSTRAVGRLKHALNARKAGHAGTLDPLASGVLPIAFGEATKTVPVVQDALKAYRFTVAWGVETETDDAEGAVVAESKLRPTEAALSAVLPGFIGEIEQRPPAFSAKKVSGERAYDLARGGTTVDLAPCTVTIHDASVRSFCETEAVFEVVCGKGTYVRALARDLGRALGCYGHVSALRRTRVGPFGEQSATPLANLEDPTALGAALRPVAASLTEIPRVLVDRNDAARLRRGQPMLLRGPDVPPSGVAYATCAGVVIAIGSIDGGHLVPARVFNLPF